MPESVRSSLTLPANTRERRTKTTPVQHQPQGEQLAIAALLLRMPPPCLGLIRHIAFIIGVRQIVERHRRRQVEQVHGAVEQMRLDRFAVCDQGTGGPVQLELRDFALHGAVIKGNYLVDSTRAGSQVRRTILVRDVEGRVVGHRLNTLGAPSP